MKHEDFVNKVRDVLNEHGGSDEISIATDRVLLDDYINRALADAVVLLSQKGYKVNVRCKESSTEDIDLPDDYISLISISSDMWEHDITHFTEIGSDEYKIAQNKFTKPGKSRPIAWITGDTSLYPVFSIEDNVNITFTYNAKYTDGLNCGEKEATAVIYMAAALVMGFFGDDNGKQRLSDIATQILQ